MIEINDCCNCENEADYLADDGQYMCSRCYELLMDHFYSDEEKEC